MSINVTQYPKTAYLQTPVAAPVKQFDTPTQKPSSVVLTFNWTVYFALMNSAANIAVEVDINAGGTAQGGVIDKIVTAKIDNSNSYNSILIYFADSGDVISCPPQTIVTLPCVTNGSACKVIAQGLATGFLPSTTITFYNYFVPPSIDPVVQLAYSQHLGSPTIQRNATNILTPGFAAPALGDILDNKKIASVNNATVNTTILGSPGASGHYVVTGYVLQVGFINVSGPTNAQCFFESTGASGILFENDSAFSTADNAKPSQTLFAMSGLQLKLDATETWRIRIIFANGWSSGFIFSYVSYTFNPNV